jgi:hypothetical protein
MIMENLKFKTLCSIVFILSTFISLRGQEDKFTIDGFSINPKLGLYLGDASGGFAGGTEINILANKVIYSVEYYRYDEFVIFGPTPAEYFNHFGIMLGKFKGDRVFRFQYQGGLNSFWGLQRTELINEGTGWFASRG